MLYGALFLAIQDGWAGAAGTLHKSQPWGRWDSGSIPVQTWLTREEPIRQQAILRSQGGELSALIRFRNYNYGPEQRCPWLWGMGSHLRSWQEVPYLPLALSLLWGVYHVHISAKFLSINVPRVLCASRKHPVSDKSLVFQGQSKLVARILKNVIYCAGWEVHIIALNALSLIKQLCISFSLPPDFTLNYWKGQPCSSMWLLHGKAVISVVYVLTRNKESWTPHVPESCLSVAASGISAPSIWGWPGWGRARPVTPHIAALLSCRIPQLLFTS